MADGVGAGDARLVADGITVRFGGLTAVADVSVQADTGEVVGIIGPNGAGKTTLFGAIAGSLRPGCGHGPVRRSRRDRVGVAPPGPGRAGPHLPAPRGVRLDDACTRTSPSPPRPPPSAPSPIRMWQRSRHRHLDLVAEALDQLGLVDVAGERAADLPPGLARLVELGRALCAQPTMLLLDEPSSGLDVTETAALATHVLDAVRTRDLGVVLIEHDMTMVLGICQRLYVLDFGACIAEGPTAEVARRAEVREAYLGTAHE